MFPGTFRVCPSSPDARVTAVSPLLLPAEGRAAAANPGRVSGSRTDVGARRRSEGECASVARPLSRRRWVRDARARGGAWAAGAGARMEIDAIISQVARDGLG
mmetsp:Transcript_32418/g.103184  ORF Transcript_32418/g.103184 Transcript_32418/m.103184 type:complete len:103 (-) Transcript_32418:2-310(-)